MPEAPTGKTRPKRSSTRIGDTVRYPLTILIAVTLCNLLRSRMLRRLANRSSTHTGAPYITRDRTPSYSWRIATLAAPIFGSRHTRRWQPPTPSESGSRSAARTSTSCRWRDPRVSSAIPRRWFRLPCLCSNGTEESLACSSRRTKWLPTLQRRPSGLVRAQHESRRPLRFRRCATFRATRDPRPKPECRLRSTRRQQTTQYLVVRDDSQDRSQHRALRNAALDALPFLPLPAGVAYPPVVEVDADQSNEVAENLVVFQGFHYPVPRHGVECVDDVQRHRRASLPEAVLAFAPTRQPPQHVLLHTGGNHSLEELADLVQQAYRPVCRRRSRWSALFTQQDQPRRLPCPEVDSLSQISRVEALKIGSHDPHHVLPDPARDSVRALRHVAGGHSLWWPPTAPPLWLPSRLSTPPSRLFSATVLPHSLLAGGGVSRWSAAAAPVPSSSLPEGLSREFAKFSCHHPVWPSPWVGLDCFVQFRPGTVLRDLDLLF